MNKNKTIQRFSSIIMTVIMVVGMVPSSVMAKADSLPIKTSGEIMAFDELAEDIAVQSVPLGTLENDLNLPKTLMVSVQIIVSNDNGMLDSGEAPLDPDSTDTVSGAAIDTEGTKDTDGESDASITGEEEATGVSMKEAEATKVTLPVTWTSSPAYDGETEGDYIFTPKLPEGYTLGDKAEMPQIIIMVGMVKFKAMSATGADYSWYDKNKTAAQFEISSTAQLKGLADIVNGNHGSAYNFMGKIINLRDNLDLSEYNSWTPIGAPANLFAGTFEGNSYTISNLTINAPDTDNVGLFGLVKGKVRNLILTDVNITGKECVGGIVGKVWGEISHCAVVGGRVTGFGRIGGVAGVVGYLTDDPIDGSYDSNHQWVINESNLISCFATCDIFATGFSPYGAGGVAGTVNYGTLMNCYAAGTVGSEGSGSFTNVGGLAGSARNASIISCFASGEVAGGAYVGGIVGVMSGSYNRVAEISNCAALNNMVLGNFSGRIAGNLQDSNESYNYAFSGMTVTDLGGGLKGSDASSADIKKENFFAGLGFSATAWDCQTGMQPVLTGFPETLQNRELPAHVGSPYPSAPGNFTAMSQDKAVKLNWSKPGSSGASSIIRYEVRKNNDDWTSVPSASTTYTFSGLTNGSVYTFCVRAVNSNGNSKEVSLQQMPLAAKDLGAIPGNQCITLNWGGTDPNIMYVYLRLDGGAWLYAGDGYTYSFFYLVNGTNYTFDIQAIARSTGNVVWEDSVTAIPIGAPTIPMNVTVTTGDAQLEIGWNKPDSNGGRAIIKYEVSKDGGTSWVSAETDTTYTFTGLDNGSEYSLQVRAVNSLGEGAAAAVTATPRKPPAIISGNSLSTKYGANGSFQVQASGTSPFTYSLIDAPDGVVIENTGFMVINKIIPVGTYTFTVKVSNGSLPYATQSFTLTITPYTPTVSDLQFTYPNNRAYNGINSGIGPVTDKRGLGLEITVFYEGIDGTAYTKFNTPPKNAGTYNVSVGIIGSENIGATSFDLGNYRILPKAVTVKPISGQSKIYGQPDPVLQYTLSETLSAGDALVGILGRVAGENMGSYSISLGSLNGGNNYTLTLYGTVNFIINSKNNAIFTISEILSKTYNGSAITPEPEVKEGSSVLIKGSDFTYSYKDNINAGTSATVIITGIGNYAGSTGSGTFIVNKAENPLSISCDNITYGQVPSPSAVTNTSGGAVSYEYKLKGADDSSYIAIVPSVAGDYTVRGTSTATANYNTATSTMNFTIGKAENTLNITCDNIIYGEVPSPAAVTNISGGEVFYEYKFQGADDSTYTATIPTAAGKYTVRGTSAATANYNDVTATANFTIEKAENKFNITCADIAYGELPSPTVFTNISGGTASYEYKIQGADDNTYTATVPKLVGNYTVRGTSAATANYYATITTVNFSIIKAAMSLMLTANPNNTQTRPGSVELSTVLPADATGNLSFKVGENIIATVTLPIKTTVFTPTDVTDVYRFAVEYSGDSNYVSKVSKSLEYSFTKSDQADLNAVASTVKYGNTLNLLPLVSGGSGTGKFSFVVSDGPGEINGNILTPTDVGEVKVMVTRAGDHDYNAKSVMLQVKIKPRVITFAVDSVGIQAYSGSTITPAPEVRDGSIILTEGIHFTYSYHNNSDAGAFATIDIIGIGNYEGSTGSVTFTIGGIVPTIIKPPVVKETVYVDTKSSQIQLTGGEASVRGHFEWVNQSKTTVYGLNTFEVRFVPEDNVLYAPVAGIKIIFSAANRLSEVGNANGIHNTTINPTARLNQPTAASVTAAVKVTKGHATLTITDRMLKAAIDKAIADAKTVNNTANGIYIDIPITVANMTGFALTLEHAALNRLLDFGVKSLNVFSLPVNMCFDTEALKQIRVQSGGNVVISVKPTIVSGLRKAYNITIQSAKNGKPVKVTSLGMGTSILGITVTPGKNEFGGYLYGAYVGAGKKIKRISASVYDANSSRMILSTDHFSVYGVGYEAPSVNLTDISSHWAKESIDYVVGRELLLGGSDEKFQPDAAITCGDLVVALGRLTDIKVSDYKTSSFTDVKADSVNLPYIEWAYQKGIVQGVGNQQFAPDRTITREELAMIVTNYAKAIDYDLPMTRIAVDHTDASSIGSAYKIAVTTMQQAGIMMGSSDNKFNPKASVTRAEVSAMLHRYIKLTIDPATAQGWAQNDDGQYLYYKDGKYLTGWKTIDNKWYYFYADGTLEYQSN